MIFKDVVVTKINSRLWTDKAFITQFDLNFLYMKLIFYIYEEAAANKSRTIGKFV